MTFVEVQTKPRKGVFATQKIGRSGTLKLVAATSSVAIAETDDKVPTMGFKVASFPHPTQKGKRSFCI